MPLRHFPSINTYSAICKVCGNGGGHYGYGEGRQDIYLEVHDFCSEHAKEYKNIYKKKIRKQKLEKLCHL